MLFSLACIFIDEIELNIVTVLWRNTRDWQINSLGSYDRHVSFCIVLAISSLNFKTPFVHHLPLLQKFYVDLSFAQTIERWYLPLKNMLQFFKMVHFHFTLSSKPINCNIECFVTMVRPLDWLSKVLRFSWSRSRLWFMCKAKPLGSQLVISKLSPFVGFDI